MNLQKLAEFLFLSFRQGVKVEQNFKKNYLTEFSTD